MSKKYFRADKRDFKPAESIQTAGHFMERHNEYGKLMEELLDKAKPGEKPDRSRCLMVFEDEECARRYWFGMTGARLYAVGIDESRILHRGDMNLLEQIGLILKAGKNASDFSARYWKGEMTDTPCVEVLVDEATMVELLGTNEQRIEQYRERIVSYRDEPEPYKEECKELFRSTSRGNRLPGS